MVLSLVNSAVTQAPKLSEAANGNLQVATPKQAVTDAGNSTTYGWENILTNAQQTITNAGTTLKQNQTIAIVGIVLIIGFTIWFLTKK